jgi:hypothetical protein
VFRLLRIGAATATLLALLGPLVGLLWEVIAPRPRYVIAAGAAVIADPETQDFIAADGRFAILTGLLGVGCGVGAYLLSVRFGARFGRLGDLALLLGIALGGLAGAVLAWRVGHLVGFESFRHAVAAARDGTTVTGALDLRATSAVLLWPFLAVLTFGVLEAIDVMGRYEPPLVAAAFPEYAGPGTVRAKRADPEHDAAENGSLEHGSLEHGSAGIDPVERDPAENDSAK